ncbi:MAG: hypothetical protein SO170_07680 [Butyribacter sp.]|nr:hypothetical protein [bacterium]MDY3854815.1 hypothetical protein [Butyribacter sp.]
MNNENIEKKTSLQTFLKNLKQEGGYQITSQKTIQTVMDAMGNYSLSHFFNENIRKQILKKKDDTVAMWQTILDFFLDGCYISEASEETYCDYQEKKEELQPFEKRYCKLVETLRKLKELGQEKNEYLQKSGKARNERFLKKLDEAEIVQENQSDEKADATAEGRVTLEEFKKIIQSADTLQEISGKVREVENNVRFQELCQVMLKFSENEIKKGYNYVDFNDKGLIIWLYKLLEMCQYRATDILQMYLSINVEAYIRYMRRMTITLSRKYKENQKFSCDMLKANENYRYLYTRICKSCPAYKEATIGTLYNYLWDTYNEILGEEIAYDNNIVVDTQIILKDLLVRPFAILCEKQDVAEKTHDKR